MWSTTASTWPETMAGTRLAVVIVTNCTSLTEMFSFWSASLNITSEKPPTSWMPSLRPLLDGGEHRVGTGGHDVQTARDAAAQRADAALEALDLNVQADLVKEPLVLGDVGRQVDHVGRGHRAAEDQLHFVGRVGGGLGRDRPGGHRTRGGGGGRTASGRLGRGGG